MPADALGAPVFSVPVQSWSTGGTVPIAFLELLGLSGEAALIDPSYVSSACTQKLAGCGKLATMPASPAEFGAWGNASRASASTLHFTDDWGTGKSHSSKDVAFDATSDPGALARAEWIKFVAAFFNLEPRANRVFDAIKTEYERMHASTEAAVAGGAAAPTVLWIEKSNGYTWDGVVYPDEWKISTAFYKAELVTSAGGVTPAASVLGTLCTVNAYDSTKYTCTPQGIKAALVGVDVVIDDTYHFNDGYTLDMFMTKFNFSSADSSADYPFLLNSKVLRHDALMGKSNIQGYDTMGTAFMEDAIVKVDVVVDDLASYLHPSLLPSTYKPRFFRNIAAG
jgi:hypothetical protein